MSFFIFIENFFEKLLGKLKGKSTESESQKTNPAELFETTKTSQSTGPESIKSKLHWSVLQTMNLLFYILEKYQV